MERSIESLHSRFQEAVNRNMITNIDDTQEKLGLTDEESELFNDNS